MDRREHAFEADLLTVQCVSLLHSREARFELLGRMKAHGLKLRMHAFEYLIARRGFACILLLEPAWNKAHIFRMKWNAEEADRVSELITEILIKVDPGIEIDLE